ncbi:MAG: prepilin-type N-terminal cleavage/methylation domain-containing protein, partial [Nitrospinota bacterium]
MWKIGICKIVSSRQYRLRQNLKSIILHITSCTSRGFTLIELLVALAIISIIFSFVIPKLMGVKEAELRGASRQLLYIVRRLSDEALFKKEKMVLAIDIKNGEYWEENSGKKLKLPDTIHIKDVVVGKGARTSGITTL